MMESKVIFVTWVPGKHAIPLAQRMIESLRAFGGALSACPVWVYARIPCQELAGLGCEIFPLDAPDVILRYPFGGKVWALADAERRVGMGMQSLVWLDPELLVVQPPLAFDLGTDADIAARPVHIRNVGQPPSDPPDLFWKGVYQALGIKDMGLTVESFVDRQILKAYFNFHGLAVRPRLGLLRRWYETFSTLVSEKEFQSMACADEIHQIFLFQAVFSALAASSVDPGRIRILPEAYNYPYHLHERVPAERRPAALNDLVCVVYEDCNLDPENIQNIAIHEPLRGWLAGH